MKQKMLFSLVFEDNNLIVVNKASGISVGGDRWDCTQNRLDRLLGKSVQVVHRIDKETSGLVVFAKNKETHGKLCSFFEKRAVEKTYIAVIHGKPLWKETVCELGLVPDGNKKHQTIIDMYRGKKSRTVFKMMFSAGNYSVIAAMPETGRTHQIRVSLAHLRHPIVCDDLYGTSKPLLLSSFKRGWRGDPQDERPLISRLALHAAKLRIPGMQDFVAPLPKDFKSVVYQFEKNGEKT
ncbi:MAG: RNA pseudouridine synthase [Spirochaetaceae bacterium]|nr:RNA pseudouridine synthase [Spirochaetaceae bacterium]